MENPNPEISTSDEVSRLDGLSLEDLRAMTNETFEPVTAEEVYDLLREIKDPEHPDLSLSQLRVVKRNQISVEPRGGLVVVEYTPTIPTCSVAVLIGLTLLRKLQLCVPSERHKIIVRIARGMHVQENQVNKQLADKERIAAAMENPNLGRMVREGVYKTDSIPEHLLIW